MPKIIRCALLVALLFSLGIRGMCAANPSADLNNFFHDFIGLNDDQIQAIREGKAVAKVLNSPNPDEVYVFGSVYIQSSAERYLALASDVDALRRLPSYLAIQKFSDPPQPADLAGFTLGDDDVRDLQRCKPGHCDVQLPGDAILAFQHSINWSAPDRTNQVNRLAQEMALQALQQYMQGGNAALGVYRDKSNPTAVAATFASLLGHMKPVPVYLPELDDYLLGYPRAPTNGTASQFYWEKVNFGLKPTLRIVQAVVYHGTSADKPAYAVVVKQLYASHYFETALDLTVCVRDSDSTEKSGFYLITIKGSQQAGLTGFKGSIVRKVAVDKTRSALERALESIKQRLESNVD